MTPAFNDLLPAVLALFDGRLPLSYRLSFRRWNVPSAGDLFALRAELDEKNGHAVNANLGEVDEFFKLSPRERTRALAGAVDFILDRVRQREAHKAALSSGNAFGPSVGAALGGAVRSITYRNSPLLGMLAKEETFPGSVASSALGAGAGASVDALRAAQMAHARGQMGVDRRPVLRVGEPMLARADDATRCGSKGKPHVFEREGDTPVMRCERCGARVEEMLLELGSPYQDEWVSSARRRCALCSFAYEGDDELYCPGCIGQQAVDERQAALVVAGAAHRRQPSAPLGMRLPFFEAVVAAEAGRR